MITRSQGQDVTVGGIPYIVGGGYEGKTRELDDTVKIEAELLGKAFNRNIIMRFNSDSLRGGAWLVNSLKGFGGNCQVGLSAGLRAIRPEGMSDDDYFETYMTLPKELYIETFTEADALKDPSLANAGNPDSRYSSVKHNSIEEAVAWLVANVDRSKILN